MPGAATASLVLGILGMGALLLQVEPAAMMGVYGCSFLFGLLAANYGKDALSSAQRGLATAGLILGVLAVIISGIGLAPLFH